MFSLSIFIALAQIIIAFGQSTTFISLIQSYNFDSTKSTQTTTVTTLNGKTFDSFLDIGLQGWIKIQNDPTTIANNNEYTLIKSNQVQGQNGDIYSELNVKVVFYSKTKLGISCSLSINSQPTYTIFSQLKGFQKWLFFVCSNDIIGQQLQFYVLQYDQTKSVLNTSFQEQINYSQIQIPEQNKQGWDFNYNYQNTQTLWAGMLRDIQIIYNISFNEMKYQQIPLIFGQYQMKYFFSFDNRGGNSILDQAQGYTFLLKKYDGITPPSFESDGIGLTFSSANQSLVLENIELSQSFIVSFWFKPDMSQLGSSNTESRILTFMQQVDDTNNRFQIQIKLGQLQFKYSDGDDKTIKLGDQIKDNQWQFLYLSIYKIPELLCLNYYFSTTTNTVNLSSSTTFVETSSFAINYLSNLYKVTIGGLITYSNNLYKADNSFIATIKDLQISQGGSMYDNTIRNASADYNCDILVGFPGNNIRCLLCKKDYFLNEKVSNILNNCQKNKCPQGKYKQNKLRQCEICDPKCQTCVGGNENQCNSCNIGYYKLKTQCYETCPIGYYNSPTSYECFQCDSICLTCSGKRSQDCIDCKAGYFKNGNVCEVCHKYCLECYGPRSSDCTKCTSLTFLHQTNCLLTCPDGYFANKLTQMCEICNSNCLTCTEISTNCLTCPQSYYLKQSGISTCEPCHQFCSDCFGSDNSNCIACNYDYFQDGNSCVEVCPENKYRNISGDYKSCEDCIDPCNTCYTKEKCRDCIAGYYFVKETSKCAQCQTQIPNCSNCTNDIICLSCSQYYLDSSKNICTPTCGQGFYPNKILNKCDPCDSACTQCIGPKVSDCSSCKDKYYFDSNQSTCKSCPDNCDRCGAQIKNGVTIIQCLKCSSGKYLVQVAYSTYTQVICQQQCSFGSFPTGEGDSLELTLDPTNSSLIFIDRFLDYSFENIKTYNYCKQCKKQVGIIFGNDYCQDCDSSGNYCTSCDLKYYLQESGCLPCNKFGCEQCFYLDSPVNEVKCTSCNSGTYLQNQKCLTKAQCEIDSTHFADTSQNVCAICNSTCKTCFGSSETQCKSCSVGYFLKMLDSPNQTCVQCPFACSECISQDFCTKCIANYFISTTPDSSQQSCVLQCSDGYYGSSGKCLKCSGQNCKKCNDKDQCLTCLPSFYKDGNNCLKCDSSCLECQGIASLGNKNCTKCQSGKKLYQLNCIDACPNQTYEDPSAICLNCDSACSACTNNTKDDCLKCNEGFYLEDPSSCSQCDSNCKSCTGPGYSNCIECSKGNYKLGDATCLKTCIDGYYQDDINMECVQCPSYCGQCTISACLKCQTGYYTITKSISGNVSCSSCNKACKECNGSSINNCLSCNDNYFLYQSTCLTKCPDNMRGIDNQCVTCADINCAICDLNNKNVCSVCVQGYSLNPTTSTCSQNCSPGFYSFQQFDIDKIPSDASQLVCQKCDISCKQCFGPLSTQCTACVSGYYYHPETNECALQCEIGYIINTDAQDQCKICSEQCLSCIENLFLYDGICYSDSCPFSTELIIHTNICQPMLKPSVRIISDSNNIQMKSDIIIQAEVVSQINITYQKWTIIAPYEEFDEIFQDVETEFATLVIPVQNIKLNLDYILQITVRNEEGEASQQFKFNTSQLIKVGKYDITSDTSDFFTGLSKLSINLSGWQASIEKNLLFDVFMYIENNKNYTQNEKNYTLKEFTKVKSIGASLSNLQGYQFFIHNFYYSQRFIFFNLVQQNILSQKISIQFKTLPTLQDQNVTFAIRGFTDQKSVTVEKQILMKANSNYKQILIDSQKKALNIKINEDFGADDSFYLNFFGSNLPSNTEDIVIAMEIVKQLFKNNTIIQDAQFHEKTAFFQMLQAYTTSDPVCEDKIDCLGQGQCFIQQIPFSWTPIDPSSNNDNQGLSESYKKQIRKCACDSLYGGSICSWKSMYYQNMTQKIKEASVYISHLPKTLLNPANILNLYSTMSILKDIIVQDFNQVYSITINFLQLINGSQIYFKFVNEIVFNYIDILINLNTNLEMADVQIFIKQLYTIHQQYIQNTIQYLYEHDGYLIYQSTIYQLILAPINQKELISNAYQTSSRRRVLDSDQDLFEFGDGSDILLSLYSIPSISINALKIQALVPLKILKNPGQLVVKIQSFLINPFDYFLNCTLISQNQVSQFVSLEIFNQGQLISTVSLTTPITIVLKKLIRSRPPQAQNITVSSYSCMNYMNTYKNWNSTHCSFQTENSTHISCSCYSLEGPVVVIALPDNIATPVKRNDIIILNQFIHPILAQERYDLLLSLGLITPSNDTSNNNNLIPSFNNKNNFKLNNYCGIYSLLVYGIGLPFVILTMASSKTKKDPENANINPIYRPHMHYHPIYAFLYGPTNIFISNYSRAFILLSIISSNMFYSALLSNLDQIIIKYTAVQIGLISSFASAGTSLILFGFPTFVKLGLNNTIQKQIKKKKALFLGFGYLYLIQFLSLLFIVATQYYITSTIGSKDNEEDVIFWLKTFGLSYLFENIIDIIYVILVLQRGLLDKISQFIALRGYTLLPQELLFHPVEEEADPDNVDNIFANENSKNISPIKNKKSEKLQRIKTIGSEYFTEGDNHDDNKNIDIYQTPEKQENHQHDDEDIQLEDEEEEDKHEIQQKNNHQHGNQPKEKVKEIKQSPDIESQEK